MVWRLQSGPVKVYPRKLVIFRLCHELVSSDSEIDLNSGETPPGLTSRGALGKLAKWLREDANPGQANWVEAAEHPVRTMQLLIWTGTRPLWLSLGQRTRCG